jgi:small subunit ribosomal protein S6
MQKNLYESIFVLDTNTPSEEVDAFIDKIQKLISAHEGEVVKVDRLGKNKLAYEILKRQYGYYVSIEFKALGTVVMPLEEEYRLSDEVLRYLNYRITTNQLKQREKDLSRKKVSAPAEPAKTEKAEEVAK